MRIPILAAVAAMGTTSAMLGQHTWTVCQDGTCDFVTIQDAVDAAADGDSITVSPGVYVETLTFGGKGITVLSTHGPAHTFIDKPLSAGNGVPGGNPSSPTVMFEHGEDRSAVLDGFTIRKGTGRFSAAWPCDCDGWQLGGGIFIANASPLIRNCVVRENNCFTYHSRGGGIYIGGGSPRFEHCEVILNGAGGAYGRGGAAWISGDAEFFDCSFRLNTTNSYHYGSGGGVWVEGGSPLLDSVRIVQNAASHGIGGLRLTSTTRLHRIYVSGNTDPAVDGTGIDLGGNVLDGDCDGNGQSDADEIASGNSPDMNGDGVPDHCECLFGPISCCPADINLDGAVTGSDLTLVLGFWGPRPAWAPADINQDGVVDGADLAVLLGSWGPCQ